MVPPMIAQGAEQRLEEARQLTPSSAGTDSKPSSCKRKREGLGLREQMNELHRRSSAERVLNRLRQISKEEETAEMKPHKLRHPRLRHRQLNNRTQVYQHRRGVWTIHWSRDSGKWRRARRGQRRQSLTTQPEEMTKPRDLQLGHNLQARVRQARAERREDKVAMSRGERSPTDVARSVKHLENLMTPERQTQTNRKYH